MILKLRKARLDEWGIRAELRRRGKTFNVMAAESGFSASSLRAALVKPSTRVNLYLATVLGIPAHELWPDWFDEEGELIPAKWRRKLSRERHRRASPESPLVGRVA